MLTETAVKFTHGLFRGIGEAREYMIKDYGLLEAMAQVGHKRIETTQKYTQAVNVRTMKLKLAKKNEEGEEVK